MIAWFRRLPVHRRGTIAQVGFCVAAGLAIWVIFGGREFHEGDEIRWFEYGQAFTSTAMFVAVIAGWVMGWKGRRVNPWGFVLAVAAVAHGVCTMFEHRWVWGVAFAAVGVVCAVLTWRDVRLWWHLRGLRHGLRRLYREIEAKADAP